MMEQLELSLSRLEDNLSDRWHSKHKGLSVTNSYSEESVKIELLHVHMYVVIISGKWEIQLEKLHKNSQK